MAFKNEYVPPLDQEDSNFFRQAQKSLNVMAEKRSKWTVDREREMVLLRRQIRREIESAEVDKWAFIDHRGTYEFSTKRLREAKISSEEVAISYELLRFWGGGGRIVPSKESLACIKDALREYKDWGVISDYKRCQLTLIDGVTGKEL